MSVEELAAFEDKLENAVLCYVEGPWAFFTTQALDKQWGNDWNDAPYEHNAGYPYSCSPRVDAGNKEPWHIVKVAWEGPFDTPADLAGVNSSYYSVEQINSGSVAWLAPHRWLSKPIPPIYAGTPLHQFRQIIQGAGGSIYELSRPLP